MQVAYQRLRKPRDVLHSISDGVPIVHVRHAVRDWWSLLDLEI